MKKEELRQGIIEIINENKSGNYICSDGDKIFIEVSQIPFIADDILGLCFADVVSRWVSVEDRLPKYTLEIEGDSLVHVMGCIKGYVNMVRYINKRWEMTDGLDVTDNITHWMNLPGKPNV